MGRRALQKLDPTLDLSAHYRTVEQMPAPFDAEAWFGRRAPLEIEIGSGKGLFLRNASRNQPEHDFIGVEIMQRYARYAAGRLARQKQSNALMLHGDALAFVRDKLTDQSVWAAHVYFPDPWWKRRHRKRRVMNELFIHDLDRVLCPGGSLHFWTDVREYFEVTLELLAEKTAWEGPLPVVEKAAEHPLDYRTHFERRMRMHSEPVYRSEFRKPA